jgi:ABC-2 type transport system permease protein
MGRLVGQQMSVQFRVRTFNLYSLLLFFLQPAIFSGVGMVLSRVAGRQTPDLVYTIIGGGIMGMWSGLVFTSTFDIARDRRDGTLELIVGSPTSLGAVEAIRTLANVLAGLVSMAAAFLAAVAIFDYPLRQANLPGVIFSLGLIVFGLWCIGVFLANFLVWSRQTGTLVNFLELPVAVFCGFMFPIRVLPEWMQVVSSIIPIRWALEAMDAALLGSPVTPHMLQQWGFALATGLSFWGLAVWLESRVHDRIRVTGELNSI